MICIYLSTMFFWVGGEHNENTDISEVCMCLCALEHSPVGWLHHVSGLWPQAAARPEARGRCQTQNE